MELFIVIVAWIVFLFVLLFVRRIREARRYRKTEKKTHPLRPETTALIGKVDIPVVPYTCNAGLRGVFFHGIGSGKLNRKGNKNQLSKLTKLKHKRKNY